MKSLHYVIENEILMKEWDYEKNDPLLLDPTKIGLKSHKKVWWKCSNGHSWLAMISNRSTHGRSCPYCSHQLPIPGETDFASLYPSLVKEWHPTKNGELKPDEVMPGTHKKVWWICAKGHEWKAEIKSRTTGVGCPYCANKKVLKGFNDLETINPALASEWHPTKNGNLKADAVTPNSGKRVWWICTKGHEWKSAVYNRTEGNGCPKCADILRTSFPEQAIFYYIKQVFPDAVNGYKGIFSSSMELDIFIPSLKVGIEYDGKRYHSSSKNQIRDSRKYEICKENGIALIRVREMSRYTPILLCDHKIEIPEASDDYLNWAIHNLCYHLGKSVIPDVCRDRKEILAYLNSRNVSLALVYPDISSEWDYEANYPLVPENFPPHSNEKVFWKCRKCAYVWEASIGDRTRHDSTGCPNCAKLRASKTRIINKISRQGSFAAVFPDLLGDWNYEKNLNVSPESLTAGSGKKVWWKCHVCNYSWSTSIGHRVSGEGCPYCNHRVVISGKNDLASLKPELLNEWDYEKNSKIGLFPDLISVGSGKKAFWKCFVCGHEWSAVIASRVKGHGCPNFRNHKKTVSEKKR